LYLNLRKVSSIDINLMDVKKDRIIRRTEAICWKPIRQEYCCFFVVIVIVIVAVAFFWVTGLQRFRTYF
jgi:hypothetical protein